MTKRNRKITALAILGLISLLCGLADSYFPVLKDNFPGSYRVEKVGDGDTITISVNNRIEKIRLIGIDAPELGQRPWGKRAKEHLEELMAASSWRVVIEYDVERRDKHGRILAYIRTIDGRLVNECMLLDGYALLFTFPPNVKYADKLRSAQDKAKKNNAGIWSGKGLGQNPSDYRREHPRSR